MDPFTEKLLARTQARKAALAKKREDVAGRSPVVTPRRPLVENNSNTVPSTTSESQSLGQNTPVKSSKGTPVVNSSQFAGGTPKSVFFEKYAKQASLKQKKCFIELEEAKETLKSTTKEERGHVEDRISQFVNNSEEDKRTSSVVKANLASNTESPSVKDRKAMYMKQVQVVSTTPIKSSHLMNANQDKEQPNTLAKASDGKRVLPTVKDMRPSLAGGRFFNDPRIVSSEKTTSKPPEKTGSLAPTKPPRVKVTSRHNEQEKQLEIRNGDAVLAKPPQSTILTKGIIPPSKPPRHQIAASSNNNPDVNEQSHELNLKHMAPEPPGDVSGPKKVVSVTSNTSQSIQKTSKRCEDEIKSDIPEKKSAFETSNDEVENVKTVTICPLSMSPNNGIVAPQDSNPMVTVSEGTSPQENPKEDLKRTLKSQKISAASLSEMDVSAHEITFNIDMSEFDTALEDEKKSIFQMTYDESIKKAIQEKNKNLSSDNDEHEFNDSEMAIQVQATFKGVCKSGYHSTLSDQYAAVVTPKKSKAQATRPYTVHERIQILLEEAAYQQNIVLQASQAVNTCLALHEGVSTGTSEEVEAERLLKFSTERRTACLDEVQKLKTGDAEDESCMNEPPNGDLPCKATLTVSGIKLSIDENQLLSKNSQEPCMYSFICIIKHNPKQMFCTKAVTSDETENNCIIFEDKFDIKNVKPSFTLDCSIFILKTSLHLINPINKHKRKNTITKSVLDSPKIKQIMSSGKKASDGASQAVTPGTTQGPVFRTSGFTLAGTCHIDLGNVHEGKHTMSQVKQKSLLTGDIQVEVTCNPEYFNQAKGFLTIFEDVGGLGDWLRYWCILDGNILHYWKYPDEEIIKPPIGSIDLGYSISDSVTVVPRDICARPHTMQLVLEKPVTPSDKETLIAVNSGGKMLIKYMLSADTKADKITWMNTINESLKDWRAWHHNLVHKNKSQQDHITPGDIIV